MFLVITFLWVILGTMRLTLRQREIQEEARVRFKIQLIGSYNMVIYKIWFLLEEKYLDFFALENSLN